MEAQRVMRRRMAALVHIVDSRWMKLCRETIICTVTTVLYVPAAEVCLQVSELCHSLISPLPHMMSC